MNTQTGDVAIVGMACMYPKAPDLRAFWENILGRIDAIDDPPPAWGGDHVYDPQARSNDRLHTKRGGYLGDLTTFDPIRFGVVPRSIDGGEPEHFLALQLAQDALEDAGYGSREFDRQKAGVILGRGTYANRGFVTVLQHTFAVDQVIDLLRELHPEHSEAELADLRSELKASLPPFNAETAPSLPHSVMCGRIANRLDLMGPAYTIDAACASSLIAVDLAMKDLRSGECDLMLAGGVQISTSYPIALLFAQLGALSDNGVVRPFHPQADGTLLGEGAGILVLKRLEDAERDDDRIYAVIRGVGTSSDGRAVGLLAPRLEGEEAALRRAYRIAGCSPDTIGLVEAHGTGTPVGDAVEIEALIRVFGKRSVNRRRCGLTAVKSMIGHTIPAAGAAGLIKTSLALYHGVLPPMLHAGNPNARLEDSPFFIVSEPMAWVHGGPEPRRAGVSAFGFGGINAHAILEAYRPPETRAAVSVPPVLHSRHDSQVIVVQAEDREALLARCRGLRDFVERNRDVALADLSASVHAEDARGETRLSLVATSSQDLQRRLEIAVERLGDPGCERIDDIDGVFYFARPLAAAGGLAFIFPGEDAQYEGMLAELCLHFPAARRWFDQADRAFGDPERGFVPSEIMFPIPGTACSKDATSQQGPGPTVRAIEAVFTANQALHAVLETLAIRPDAVVGHGAGEYSALAAAGVVGIEGDAGIVQLVRDTSRAIERAGGAAGERLPFDPAHHPPPAAPACEGLEASFRQARFVRADIPLYSCAIAGRVPADPEQVRQLACEQWMRPIRFQETVEQMYADGIRIFVEVGPGGRLTTLVEDVLRGKPHVAGACDSSARPGLARLHRLLALLTAQGVEVDLGALRTGRPTRLLPIEGIWNGDALPEKQSNMMQLSLELPRLRIDRGRLRTKPAARTTAPARPRLPSIAPGGEQPVPTTGPGRDAAAVIPSPRERAVAKFFANMERFLEIQRDVMCAAIGGAPDGPPHNGERPGPASGDEAEPVPSDD